ncbi:proton-conducting transporter transmembrane domain-containing protein, partial [Georgenia sp.]
AMVNLGLYGVLRVGFDLLGGGPQWWWLLVLAVGALSALYGVLQASAATDLKRLLAYSTTENLGLIFIGVGAAGVFAAAGDAPLASLLMIAAVLHTVNHAAFKTLLFLGAGAAAPACGIWTRWVASYIGCQPPPCSSGSVPLAPRGCPRETGSSPNGCCSRD